MWLIYEGLLKWFTASDIVKCSLNDGQHTTTPTARDSDRCEKGGNTEAGRTMTKLLEWLTGAALILGPWSAVVTHTVETEFTRQHFWAIAAVPVVLVVLFGLVSVAVIAYRVYTFNDCCEAANELQQQIKEAKADLTKKGLKFD